MRASDRLVKKVGVVRSVGRIRTAPAFFRCNRGVNAVEFALVAPLLLLILLTMSYVGAYVAIAHGASQLAADALRYSMSSGDPADRHLSAKAFVEDPSRRASWMRSFRIVAQVREADGHFEVEVVCDMTHLPPLPIVSALVSLPQSISRVARSVVP